MNNTKTREARIKKGITKGMAADKLHISLKGLYNYEHGKPIPSDVLINMSRLYECTTDYLLGINNYNIITAL